MIQNLINLLNIDDFMNESYNIQVAKGLYNYETKAKKIYKQKMRMQILKNKLKQRGYE